MYTFANHRHTGTKRGIRHLSRWALTALMAVALVTGLASAASATVLNITVVGNGDVVEGVNIDCPSVACSQNYGPAGILTLVATPDSDWYFAGWSGHTSAFSSTTTASTTISPIGASPDPRNVTATFKPKYAASINSQSADEFGVQVTMTVTLDRVVDAGETVTFSSTTNNVTATLTQDFGAPSGGVTISAGNISGIYTIPIIDDSDFEGTETFEAGIAVPSANARVGSSPGTVTIVDDDYQLQSISSPTAAEDSGSLAFVLTLDRPVDMFETVSFTYSTSDGSATLADSDYASTSGTLTINALNQTGTINVPMTPDGVVESDETMTLTVVGNSITIDEPGATGTGTITNDDYAFSSISSPTADEDAGNLVFTITLDRVVAAGDSVSLNYATSDGTATVAAGDYTATSGTLTITAGNQTGTVTVPILDDGIVESSESFTMDVSASSTNIILASASGTGTITDEDYAFSSITSPSGDEDSGNLIFTVTLDRVVAVGDSVALDYMTSDGTATVGDGDYTATSGTLTITAGNQTGTITVPILDDGVVESSETFDVILSATPPGNIVLASATGTGTITDEDYQVSTVADESVLEDAGTMVFNVSLDRTVAAGDSVSLDYTTGNAGDTATPTADYTPVAGGTLTIPAGSQTGTITITIVDDALLEPDETFTLNLAAGSSNNTTLTNTTATGTIRNDDYAITITPAATSVDEGNSFSVTVSLDRAIGVASPDVVTATFSTADGTAASGSDYIGVSQALTFNGSTATSQTITIPTLQDSAVELDETLTITLSGISGNAALVTSVPITLTVANEDTYGFSVTNSGVNPTTENGGSDATFSITIDQTPLSGHSVTINFATRDDSAVAGEDYASNSGIKTFTDVSGPTQTVSVQILDDSLVEPTQKFWLDLSAGTLSHVNPSAATADADIDDDMSDTYDVSIADTVHFEQDGNAIFVVTVDQPVVAGVNNGLALDYVTSDSTATAPADYTGANSTSAFFAINSTTGIISIPIVDDGIQEQDESFNITISVPAGIRATISDDTAGAVIRDNDFVVTFIAGPGGDLLDAAASPIAAPHFQYLPWNGTTAQVEALPTASSGYYFTGWTITGSATPTNPADPKLVLTSVQGDVTALATFSNLYTVTFTSTSGGTLLGNTSQIVAWGTGTTPVEAVQNVGYSFDAWDNGYGVTNPLTIPTVTGNMTVQATFITGTPATVSGCATATGSNNSSGFATLDDFDVNNLAITGTSPNGRIQLQTGVQVIDPNSVVIPFEQEVFVTYLYEGAGYVSDFGWMYYEEAVNDNGTPNDKTDDTFLGWNNISATAKRVLFRNIQDDAEGIGCCNGGNGILDSDSGIGGFPNDPFSTTDEAALKLHDDGTGVPYEVDDDGFVTPKDMRKRLVPLGQKIPAGAEIIFWLTADRDYTTTDSNRVYFNKRDWNPDTYTACDTGGGTFTKTYQLGTPKTGGCNITAGWLASPAITRMNSYFNVTLTGDYDLSITPNQRYDHVIVGAPVNDPNQWILGWEDLFGGGDADHNDMVFRVERRTGGTAQLQSANAIEPLNANGTSDPNSFYTAVTFEVFDRMPCGSRTGISYWVSIDDGVNWVKIEDWDTILESSSSRTKGTAVTLPWAQGTPEYTFRSRRIDFAARGLTGRKLIWKTLLESEDETCQPEILGVNLRGTVSTHGFFSRATPVVQTNMIYTGNYETPLGTWAVKENRGHLEATRIYDPLDTTQPDILHVWDAGDELASRVLSTKPRTIYTPNVTTGLVSGESLVLNRGACSGITTEYSVPITVSTAPAAVGNTIEITKTYPNGSYTHTQIEDLINYQYDTVVAGSAVTLTKTTLPGTIQVIDGNLTTTKVVTNLAGTSTIVATIFDGTTTTTINSTQSTVVSTQNITNGAVSTVLNTRGDGCTTAFTGTLANSPISATTLRIYDSREAFEDVHTEDLQSNLGSSGNINRATGEFTVTFDVAPGVNVPVKADYQHYTTSPGLQTFAKTTVAVDAALLGLNDTLIQGVPPTKIHDFNADGFVNDTDADWLIDWYHGYRDPNTSQQKAWLLGPIDHSAPAVLITPGKPLWYFGGAITTLMRTEYDTFEEASIERPTVLFVGARDGMLHAFYAGHFSRLDSNITTNAVEQRGHFKWKVVSGGDPNNLAAGEVVAPVNTVLKDTTSPEYGNPTIQLVVPDGDSNILKPNESKVTSPGTIVISPDYGTGEELWAFIPANLLPRLKNAIINEDDRAFVDASPAIADAYVDTDNDGAGDTWKSVLIAAEGNGGDTVFCLDVTNPTAPSFMWEFSDPDLFRSRSSPAIAQIGPTNFIDNNASTPLADKVRWTAFFVTGIVEDATLFPAIYMVDISTGLVLDSPLTAYMDGRIDLDDPVDIDGDNNLTASEIAYGKGGVPSGQPAVIDSDGNGYLDRVYLGTTNGLLYKVNIPDDPTVATPAITHCVINTDYVANQEAKDGSGNGLGYSTVPVAQRYQPIYASPTVVVDNQIVSGSLAYNVKVMFGTSDSPFYDEGTDTNTTRFRFYVYIDSDTKTQCTGAELDWFFELPQGARIYSSAFASAGKIYFGTSTAVVEDPCSNLAAGGTNEGRLYGFDIDTGQSELNDGSDLGLDTGNINTSPLVEDEQLYYKTADGLRSLGSGVYNNPLRTGGLSSPSARSWFEILDQ